MGPTLEKRGLPRLGIRLLMKPLMILRARLADGLTGLLHALAVNRVMEGDYSRAETACRLSLIVRDTDRRATLMLVRIYQEQGRISQGIRVLENWLSRFPHDAGVHVAVSVLFGMIHDRAKTSAHLNIASRLTPESAKVLEGFAFLYRQNGDLDNSTKACRAALKATEYATTLLLLAHNLIDQGKQAEAAEQLERAVRSAPDFGQLYLLLAQCGHYRDPSHAHIEYMKRRLESGELSASARASFQFALGTALDRMGLWDEAFGHFKAANDLSWKVFGSLFSMKHWSERVMEEKKVFDRNFLDAMRADDKLGESVVFVVGMPRSGSTLVEQILASHPDVRAGGERHDVSTLVSQLEAERNETYPSCIRRLPGKALCALGERYLIGAVSLLDGYKRIVDKALFNFLEIGFLAIILPGAKFIHCRRNVLDTCISCYLTHLPELRFTHDLRTIGLVYGQYERLMSYWHSVLPGRILDVQYETLVSESESQIRRLLYHCELPWHPACANPQDKNRAVFTASAAQVKLPINCRSVARWKHYEKHLGPLVAALQEYNLGSGSLHGEIR